MLRYLLDTNIASFLIRKTHPVLDDRIRLASREAIAISSVTEAEMRFGVALNPQAKVNASVALFLEAATILPWDSRCAQHYAALCAQQKATGRPLSIFDSMIAAHALAYEFVLISNDHVFEQVEGLHLEDWTKGPQSS